MGIHPLQNVEIDQGGHCWTTMGTDVEAPRLLQPKSTESLQSSLHCSLFQGTYRYQQSHVQMTGQIAGITHAVSGRHKQ